MQVVISSATEGVVDGQTVMLGELVAKNPRLASKIIKELALWLDAQRESILSEAKAQLDQHRGAVVAAEERAAQAQELLASLEHRLREEFTASLQPQVEAWQAEVKRMAEELAAACQQRDTAVENAKLQTRLQNQHWGLSQTLMAGDGAAAVAALREIRKLELLRQEAAIAAERKALE